MTLNPLECCYCDRPIKDPYPGCEDECRECTRYYRRKGRPRVVNGVKFFEHWFDEISFENEDPKPATNPDLINLPHSPERIKVYRERFLRGEAIFHPDDF